MPPPVASAPRGHDKLWRLLAVGLVGGCLLALRRPDALANPQFWAEDAVVFFDHAFHDGFLSVLRPNAGYFHTWPRLGAFLAQYFDPAYAPALYAYAGWVVSIGGIVFVAALPWPGGWTTRAIAGLSIALIPHFSYEVFLTPTNLQWLLAPCLVALIIAPPELPKPGRVLVGGFAVLTALTSPFVVTLVPLIIWRLTRCGSSGERITLAALLVAAASQSWAIWSAPMPAATVPSLSAAALTPRLIGEVLTFRLGLQSLVPAPLWPDSAVLRVVGGAIILLGFARAASLPGPSRSARLMLAIALGSFLVATLVRTRTEPANLLDHAWGDRYFFTMRVLLAWMLILVGSDPGPRQWRWISRGGLALMLASAAPTFQAEARLDLRWRDYMPALRAGQPVDIPIHPSPWIYRHRPATPAPSTTPGA